MSYPEVAHVSPNCSLSPERARSGLVLHHTVLDLGATLSRLMDRANQVSYHCVISVGGERHTLVPDEAIAWHAGVSAFRGRTHCNLFLLGLAFEGDTYQHPLTPEQLESAIEWLEPRWKRYGWTTEWVTDHRQISPGRKNDLNPAEWNRINGMIERWARA